MSDLLLTVTYDPQKLVEVISTPSSKLPSGAKLVFLLLVFSADFSRKSSLSQRTLSTLLGLSERQVRKHLSVLRSFGFISKTTSDDYKTNADIYDVSQYAKGGYVETKINSM